MLKELPNIPLPDELIKLAFKRASKEARKKSSRAPKHVRAKRAEEKRVKIVSLSVKRALEQIIKGMQMPESQFYRELIDANIGAEKIRGALASLEGVVKTIDRFEQKYSYEIRTAKNKEEIYGHRKEFYGKTASLLRRIEEPLEFLAYAKKKLRAMPDIKEEFTVVISGPPNVGKSSLLRAMTSARPKVESYPFTTQRILLGYFEHRHKTYQVIDTPGLLDRPPERRNPVEKNAVLALKHLMDVNIFVFDPSETCGFPVAEQMNTFRQVSKEFGVDIVAVNKSDVMQSAELKNFLNMLGKEAYVCSAKNGTGIKEIVGKIIEMRESAEQG